MRLEILHVPECPNQQPLLDRLREVTELPITTREINSDGEAAEFGMAGSPTLLIDGVDPFADPDQRAGGLSCRLYRDQDGRVVPTPSIEQLREVITGREQSATPDRS